MMGREHPARIHGDDFPYHDDQRTVPTFGGSENMTSPAANPIPAQVEAVFGTGTPWTSLSNTSAVAWEKPGYHLIWSDEVSSETGIRRLWEERKGHQPYSVVLLAPAGNTGNVQVAGPQDARPIRELPAGRVLDLLQTASSMTARQATSFLAREFGRLEDAVVPGLKVKDLLTPHFARERLRWPINAARLSDALGKTPPTGGIAWRSLFQGMGYQVDQLPKRGYLLRHEDSPVAVVHPYRDASQLGGLTENEALPEGLVLADCGHHGAQWGILEATGRYRLFQRNPPVGPATGQYLEIDTSELGQEDRLYLGLFTPESLRAGGWLTEWVAEAKDFGDELRRGLEDRLVRIALPKIAQGMGEFLESQGTDLNDQERLREIEEAALTLVFRYMFLLHTEARGYLPLGSPAYRSQSAVQLAEDTLHNLSSLDGKSTQRWDRLGTLIRMVRSGDRSSGVPAYNGSLFAADGFPGSSLLERVKITDNHLGPALVAIAHESDNPDSPGLDFAGLQIDHLGSIYESLLALRLSRSPEDLVYDTKSGPKGGAFRPRRPGDKGDPEVARAQLYYQSEVGGRKAGGVFYTRREFVEHLLNHSLSPALEDHLGEVREVAETNPSQAAHRLFDFSVVAPAMGSAHFLTSALYMMADRIDTFLAEVDGLPGISKQLSELTQEGAPVSNPSDAADLLRRLILKRCIYGVDISPMAVEVANVTLWLASFVPGLALSYLGSNLKCGDALVGVADPQVVGAVGSTMVQRLDTQPVRDAMNRAAQAQREIAAIPDRTPEEVKHSEELNAELVDATEGLRNAFNLWAAEPLGLEGGRQALENHAAAVVARSEPGEIDGAIAGARNIAGRYRFFHWPLEFPGVFHRERPGFDVVVGNPPWNKVKFEMPSFLALHDPGIRGVRSGIARDRRAEKLFKDKPWLRQEIEDIREQIEEQRRFFRSENGYSLQGSGDTDLYKLFCERYASIARRQGFIGVVLPRVAFLNDGSRGFRRWFFRDCRPSRIDAIMNSGRWAFNMEPRYTVALTAAQVGVPVEGAVTVTGPARNEREFGESVTGVGVPVSFDALASWTPPPADDSVKEPTWEPPLLPTPGHVGILSKLRCGVRFDALRNPGNQIDRKGGAAPTRLAPYTEMHESGQRRLFNHPPGEGRIPVWKGRSFDQYDPSGKEPAGYIKWEDALGFVQTKRLGSRVFKGMFTNSILSDSDTHPIHRCRIAFRDSTRSTDSRTVRSCLVPPQTPLTHTAPNLVFREEPVVSQAHFLGIMNSLSFDWLARRYVESHLTYFVLDMLTFPQPDDTPWERIGRLASRLSCVDGRFAEFAYEAGVECGKLTPTQRNDMRAEIDALVARAYGLTADELRFIFTDFTENAVPQVYRNLVLEKFEGL